MDICESQTVGELLVDPKKGMILNMRTPIYDMPSFWKPQEGVSVCVVWFGIPHFGLSLQEDVGP